MKAKVLETQKSHDKALKAPSGGGGGRCSRFIPERILSRQYSQRTQPAVFSASSGEEAESTQFMPSEHGPERHS